MFELQMLESVAIRPTMSHCRNGRVWTTGQSDITNSPRALGPVYKGVGLPKRQGDPSVIVFLYCFYKQSGVILVLGLPYQSDRVSNHCSNYARLLMCVSSPGHQGNPVPYKP